MNTRRKLKDQARKVFRKHYRLFIMLCLAASVLGGEFAGSVAMVKNRTSAVTDTGGGIGLDVIDKIVELAETQAQKREIFGRSRGVLSALVNGLSSGKYLATLAVGIRSIAGSDSAAAMIMIVLSVLFQFFIQTFVINLGRVILRRMFLEGRLYEKVPTQRVWFLLKVKRWFRAGITIFVMDLLQTFWNLTIIGGFIKYYSYRMVPFITAENPEIKPLDAVSLSRNMMHGHKWECFCYDLSFLGWLLLGILTGGLTDIFYTNAYKTAAMGEYYAELRRLAKKNNVASAELLNDRYLFEKPERTVLEQAYADIVGETGKTTFHGTESKGIRKILLDVFGLTITHPQEMDAYEKEEARVFRVAYDTNAYRGTIYPTRLYPLPEKKKRKWIENLNYLRHYSVWSVILIFFLLSFMGWLWEVSLHLVTNGEFVNRGVLHGPWLPIYGAGGVMILLLLNKFRRKPALEFGMIVLLCGCVEYVTSYYLELLHGGMKWWDYNGYFLNLNGRICAEGLLVFGIGGMLIVYVLAPLLDNLIRRIPVKALIASCLILVCAFCADHGYSERHPNAGKGITSGQVL